MNQKAVQKKTAAKVNMSIEAKIDEVLDILVARGSLSATSNARNKKYNEIMEKLLNGLYKESDLDLFIDRTKSGFYENENKKRKL